MVLLVIYIIYTHHSIACVTRQTSFNRPLKQKFFLRFEVEIIWKSSDRSPQNLLLVQKNNRDNKIDSDKDKVAGYIKNRT